MSTYNATLNRIETVFCQFNFVCDENGDKIVFENKDFNFKQSDYIVNEDILDCQREDKNSYDGKLNI